MWLLTALDIRYRAIRFAVVTIGTVQKTVRFTLGRLLDRRFLRWSVGAKYAGTALGLTTTMSLLGGTIGPPAGNALAEINPSYAFIFWSGMVLFGLIMFSFAKETGWKHKNTMIVEASS